MACRNRELSGEESAVPAAATLSEALLFATMCIVGFPVDAHLIDGSVFSGIFFTASVQDDSGIVLKNATMIKKGKSAANVGNGSVIETLVVRFADLLQVVAKGVALPENGVACNIAGDPFKITVDINEESRQKEEPPNALGNERQAENNNLLGESGHSDKKSEIHKKEIKDEVQDSKLLVDPCIAQSKSAGEICSNSTSKPPPNGEASVQCENKYSLENNAHSNGVPSRVSTCHTSAEVVHPEHSNPTPKGSKLNPGAKLFCPSVANHRSVTPPAVPTVANVAYVPDNLTVVPIASPQPDVEMNSFVSQSPLPVKFLPYSNLVAGNGISDSQYSQPFIGHVGARTQAVRCSSQQLHPIHPGSSYVTSNSQNVMVGQGGQQFIYTHPVSHDVNQAAAAFSQVPLRPSLTPHVGHPSKHQGSVAAPALQLYITPHFMSGGQQQLPVQSHSSFNPPPFPVIHPISVPGATTGFFTPKQP